MQKLPSFPSFLKKTTLACLYKKYKNRLILNHFKTTFKQNVLISYIVYPFRRGINLSHTNLIESLEIAQVFKDLNFNVDVANYDYEGKIDYHKYDIIFGFGEPLINSYYKTDKKILRIYYGTGMHVCHQNYATIKRIEEVYNKKGQWVLESGRIVDKTWSVQTSLVDCMVVLGNNIVIESYKKYFPKTIYSIPASFYHVIDANAVIENKDYEEARYHFWWFGSGGLIHKGLDLLLEIFIELPEYYHLHICGPVKNETKFEQCFLDELYNTKNIHTYGFLSLDSPIFKELCKKCAFTIFPSCSEGNPTSVINLMANGIIPLVTETAGVRTEDFGIKIKKLNKESIVDAIYKAVTMDKNEIKERSIKCFQYTRDNHSIENFSKQLKSALMDILSL